MWWSTNPSIDIINWQTRKFDKDHFINKFNEKKIDNNDIGICIHHNYLTRDDIEFLDDFFKKISEEENIVLKRRLLWNIRVQLLMCTLVG